MRDDHREEGGARSGFGRKTAVLAAVLALIVLGAVAGLVFSGAEAPEAQATFAARRGPLTISVLESGTIQARDQIVIKNEVEGKTSIISLVAEGAVVEKGDLLVELDASALQDEKIDQEIKVQNAEAAYINARESLAVTENQAASDIDKAELALQFARQDLQQYREGEYPNALAAAQSRITLAQEELTRARETLRWSETLFSETYISQTQLQADRLAEKQKALELELARNDLELLQNFTYQRKIAQLESDLGQAEMALERTRRKATADVVQAEADRKAKVAEFNRQKEKLAKIEDQIAKTRIVAPEAGLVIYATSAKRRGWRHNTEPLAEGQQVQERQELIYLPTTDSAMAEVAVHETNLKKVAEGLPAKVTVDALPGKAFAGTVSRIAPLPNAESVWINPDLKVYNTEIVLEASGGGLRTGMSCRAEIIVAHYEDAVYVPVQAVLRVQGKPSVFVWEDDRAVARPVSVGMDNNRMIHIVEGLAEGEPVLLAPPLAAGEVAGYTAGALPGVSGKGKTDAPGGRRERPGGGRE